jgi:Zn-dependent peptidase ImmA (M78 family)
LVKTFITSGEMDIIAEQILLKAGIPTFWQGIVQRVDIDALIEFEYGLEIQWKNIDHFAEDGVVLAAIVPKHKLIYMNDTKKSLFKEKIGTMNFSKAHELGHWILHVTDQQEYEQLSFDECETFYCRSFSRKPPKEIQADMFAASVLMPKGIIHGAIGEMKERGKVTFSDLYRLRDRFEVSISALTARVQELKLLCIVDKKIYLSEAESIGQASLF